MDKDLALAKQLLTTEEHTCVLCRDDRIYTSTRRGVAPLLDWLDSGLDLLFAGDNDLLVGVNSARWLEGRWPRLTVQVVSGHHFQYFLPPEGQRVLARWLG